MKNILLTIEYDGSGFHGWQIQSQMRTVQGELQHALERVTGVPVELTGSSRTDAGVHAWAAAANFHTESGIPTERIPFAANNMLSDIRIISAVEKPKSFNARFDATAKTYRYLCTAPAMDNNDIGTGEVSVTANPGEEAQPRIITYSSDIFQRNYRYQLNENPDKCKMIEAAKHFVGTHDFNSFRTFSPDAPEDAHRTIKELNIKETEICDTKENPIKELAITVTGNAFLYNMVRIIAGTLIEVGLGKRTADEMPAIIAAKDRRLAGHTAAAAGLYLERVYFDK